MRSLLLFLFAWASLFAQSSTYMGPKQGLKNHPNLVRVVVHIQDGVEPSGLQIQSVEFDRQSIPLKPRDIYGSRGSASFQLKPGVYKLRWSANRDRFAWPRSVSFEEIVTISPRDDWIQIAIVGDKAEIN